MTKLLSQLLEAREPQFRQTVQKLEAASGYACHDIRLSESINREVRSKIADLGLDPDDTTGEELYHALQQKLKDDDTRLVKRLRQISAHKVSAAGDLAAGLAYAVGDIAGQHKVFALKGAAAKRLLSKYPPKKTMKTLGYRSMASMLKHEPIGLLLALALVIESSAWENHYDSALKNLNPSDFEERAVAVYALNAEKRQAIGLQLLAANKQTVMVNKESASLVILPLPSVRPNPGITTATLAVAANGLNSIYASSSYLRLSVVAKDFGERLEHTATDEPNLSLIDFFSSPLSWETVQRFFHHMSHKIDQALETHISAEEIVGWQPVETLIHRIAPEMAFWRDSGHLGRLDGTKPVSFNVLDNALNVVNARSYGQHYYHHGQRALWQEFILRYIKPELLKSAVDRELSPKLEVELANV